jgi:long-chain acyl-CoA synthetase
VDIQQMKNTFPSILQYRAYTHPNRIAYVAEDKSVSYKQYCQEATKVALYLKSIGIKKGDRIGILDLNTLYAVNLVSGAMLLGAIPVSLNWRSIATEIKFILEDAGVNHFFYGSVFFKLVESTTFSTSIALHKIEDLNSEFSKENDGSIDTEISFDDVFIILYTSGTTGNPKGVVLSYRNFYTCQSLCIGDTPGFGPDTRNLVVGPLYSIFGFGIFFITIYAGATNILIKMFEPNLVCNTIIKERVSNALLVPVMIRAITSIEGVEKMDFSELKHVQYGGSPMSPDVLVAASEIFKCYFTQVYGLTETAGMACSLRYDDHSRILENTDEASKKLLMSAGKPSIGIEMKILDDNGELSNPNSPGEVYIKGENISKGYWNREKETAEQFLSDGWFKTGDMGYFNEEGFLFLVDRKNDMIVSKGMNIFPAEIEKILDQHPQIKEVAIVAVPDDSYGEGVCAVIVLKQGELSLSELRNWCKGKLADHKLPIKLEIRTELPRNPTGKLLRRLVKESFWKNEQRNIKG